MWEFKTNQLHRQSIIFLDYFIYQKQMNISDLQKSLDCDFKTVQKIVDTMNSTYDIPFLYFDEKSKILVSDYQVGTNQLNIFKSFFDNTEFQLLEYIFVISESSVTTICEDLYISESTYSRYLKHLKKNLKKYGLDIIGKNPSIVGDELLVRNFFLQYFMEKNECDFFSDFEFYQEISFSIFNSITSDDSYKRYRPLYNYFRWVAFVSFLRISQGFSIDDKIEVGDDIKESLSYLITETQKHDLIDVFKLKELNYNLLNDFLYFILQETHSDRSSNLADRIIISNIYNDLLTSFNIELKDDDKSKLIEILFHYYLGYYGKTYFLFDEKAYHYSLLKKTYPKSMSKIDEIVLDKLKGSKILTDEDIKHFILVILSYTPEIMKYLSEYEEKLHINLFFMIEHSKVEYIYNLLSSRFNNVAIFDIFVSDKLLKVSNLGDDLWITNIHTINSDNLLNVDPLLINSQMPMIRSFIENKLESKKEN